MFTGTLVQGERITRKVMRERDAWSIEEALLYQPVKTIRKKLPVYRSGRIIAWLVDYEYDFEGWQWLRTRKLRRNRRPGSTCRTVMMPLSLNVPNYSMGCTGAEGTTGCPTGAYGQTGPEEA